MNLKLQSLENKVFEFEFESSRSLKVFSLILLFLYITINRGSDIFYLFVYCLSCLNIN